MTTHSGILSWEIPGTEEDLQVIVHGGTESDMTERLNMHTYKENTSPWRIACYYPQQKLDNFPHLYKSQKAYFIFFNLI